MPKARHQIRLSPTSEAILAAARAERDKTITSTVEDALVVWATRERIPWRRYLKPEPPNDERAADEE